MKKNTPMFFITGTDTGVGKTLVCSALLQAINESNLTSVAVKPVASGCERTENGLVNEDALALQENMSLKLSYAEVNPIALEPAIAPHIAAAQAEVEISVEALADHCRAMTKDADIMLIEGAGGWRVPLNDQEYFSDLPKALKIPVIIVVALRLGCINQALLTAEAVRADGLQVGGWVANSTEPEDMSVMEENLLALKNRINAPFLGFLPYLEKPDPRRAASYLDISYIT